MAIAFPPPPSPTAPANPNLYAAIDMGTNSFKMLIVRLEPSTGKFFALDRHKEQVLLGQSRSPTALIESQPSISPQGQIRAILTLQKFTQFVKTYRITSFRFVATSAVREAANQLQFLQQVREDLGINVEVLSGEEEAKYVYLGILQFLPCFDKLVLCIDIGGGSTEFIIGKLGKLKFAKSLKLGHVTLTEKFVNNGEISTMREHIRMLLKESGVIENVKKLGFEIAVGSSGTIRAIEKAIFLAYASNSINDGLNLEKTKRNYKFNKKELSKVVEKLCEGDKLRTERFFKRRSEFILAGAILLEEIFDLMGIEEMEVSNYAVGEGLIAEKLAIDGDYGFCANERWKSVVRLATRFNSEKKMTSAAQYAYIAKVIFEGLRNCNEFVVSLDETDLEYLEAACLLHKIEISPNDDYLHGYRAEEVKLIMLLARYHKKKLPNFDHLVVDDIPNKVMEKFTLLSPIIRISVFVKEYLGINIEGTVEFSRSSDGFKLILDEIKDKSNIAKNKLCKGAELKLGTELENFKMVFGENLSVSYKDS